MALPLGDLELEGQAQGVDDQADLGRETASGATNALPPAAPFGARSVLVRADDRGVDAVPLVVHVHL